MPNKGDIENDNKAEEIRTRNSEEIQRIENQHDENFRRIIIQDLFKKNNFAL